MTEETLATLRAVMDQQAEDEGLWFVAVYSTEAYLQAELRRLHAAVEAALDGEDGPTMMQSRFPKRAGEDEVEL